MMPALFLAICSRRVPTRTLRRAARHRLSLATKEPEWSTHPMRTMSLPCRLPQFTYQNACLSDLVIAEFLCLIDSISEPTFWEASSRQTPLNDRRVNVTLQPCGLQLVISRPRMRLLCNTRKGNEFVLILPPVPHIVGKIASRKFYLAKTKD